MVSKISAFCFNRSFTGRSQRDYVFYDASCGLCSSFARFASQENKAASRLLLRPLQGEEFQELRQKFPCAYFPDSLIVLNENSWFFKSQAVAHTLMGLGGLWRILGHILQAIPYRLSNFVYDFIARHRHQWFKNEQNACVLGAKYAQIDDDLDP